MELVNPRIAKAGDCDPSGTHWPVHEDALLLGDPSSRR